MKSIDSTHDPALKSWVASANQAGTDFPIQNLPFAIFRRTGTNEDFRGGVAIGDQILDLRAMHTAGLLSGLAAEALAACDAPTLNRFMSMGKNAWSALRRSLSESLRSDSPHATTLQSALTPQAAAEYALPATIGDYTDFYASVHHATAVGRLFRPDSPLTPNYKWVPIGYHGRASSIGVSGQKFPRPVGQTMPAGANEPVFGPSKRLDYELEMGVFIGSANTLGHPVRIEQAEDHIFGLCLLNDWSARDIQAWEYQPLGPFLAKNFATTISPWIVTLEALAPYRLPFTRPAGDPRPLAYLDSLANNASGAFDIELEALIQTAGMRKNGEPPQRISRTSFRHCYWTVAQLVAHHTVNGCNLQPGDLLGTGTQSGPPPEEAGSLLELTLGGKQPLRIGTTDSRTFLEDGDRVMFRGWCEKTGATRIGFGEAVGEVLPAMSV